MHTFLCLVRHGATEWNYEGRAQGQADIPLNSEGIRQAQVVARRLAQETWDVLYSSPLMRAAATAEAVGAAIGLPVLMDDGLKERNCSPIEGTTNRERALRWPNNEFMSHPEWESNERVGQRAQRVVREIVGRHPAKRILCVSHGGFIYNLLKLEGLHQGPEGEAVHIGQPNTAITRLIWDGESFAMAAPVEFAHLLVGGLEYSAERGRVSSYLAKLALPELPPQITDMATAVESAWDGGALVGFVRAFTDGVRFGYVDVVGLQPGGEATLQVMMERLGARFPAVSFTRLPVPQFDLPAGEPAQRL